MHIVGEQTQSRAVPVDQLHPIGSLDSEDVHSARERIGLHVLAHQRGKPFGAFAVMRCTA